MAIYLLLTGLLFWFFGLIDFTSGFIDGDKYARKLGTIYIVVGILCFNQADDLLEEKTSADEQTEPATTERSEGKAARIEALVADGEGE